MTKNSIRTRVLFAFISISSILSGTACASASKEAVSETQTMNRETAQQFEKLLASRDAEYEHQRSVLINDPGAVGYLLQRSNDSDRVTAFIARVIHQSIEDPSLFKETEEFLNTKILANQQTMSRTAGGWQPHSELLKYIRANRNPEMAAEYLLLHALMHANAPKYVLSAIGTFYATPYIDQNSGHKISPLLSSPETYIRAVLASPNYRESGAMEQLITNNLPTLDKLRVIQAIDHEQRYAARNNLAFPEELVAYRKKAGGGR